MRTLNVYIGTPSDLKLAINSADIMLSYDRVSESVPMMSFVNPYHGESSIDIRVHSSLVLSFLSRYKFHVGEVMGVDINTDPLWRLLNSGGVQRGNKSILIKLGL